MSTDHARAAAEALNDHEHAMAVYAHLADLRDQVKAEIKALEGELACWDTRANVAWSRLMIADSRLCDARDRLRAENRKDSQPLADIDRQRASSPLVAV